MTAATTTQAPGSTQPASGLAAVPRAIWVVLGTLAVATAGLAGALVMRSVDSQPTPPAVASQVAPTQVAGSQTNLQPQPQAQAQQAAPVQQFAPQQQAEAPRPAPVKQAAKPAPARPVQQASGSAHAQPPVEQVAQAPAPSRTATPIETTRAAICNVCGTVQSSQEVKEKGEGSGLGAIGGGLAGHEAEKHVRATTAYDVQVRMEDGSVRSFRRTEPLNPGTRVTVDGSTLRVGGQGAVNQQPRTIRTSVDGA